MLYDDNGCYQHSSNNENSESYQQLHEYDYFWHVFESFCEGWSKLIRIGTLFTCIDLGNLEKCNSLIEKGVDVNTRHDGSNHYISSEYLNLTSVEVAIQKNQDLILDLLIKNGAKIFLSTALNSAIKFDAQKVFDFLLRRSDIDINYRDENGNTALHHVFKGYIDKSFDYLDSWTLNTIALPNHFLVKVHNLILEIMMV